MKFLFELFGFGDVLVDEMALILEGRRPKFAIPLLGLFYHKTTEETVTVTIPYSRVIKVKKSRDDFPIFVGITNSIGGFILLLVGTDVLVRLSRSGIFFQYVVQACNCAGLVLWFLFSHIGGPYCSIKYRRMDGKERTVVFRFTGSRNENFQVFKARIEEFLVVTRSFTEGKNV